MLFSSMIFLWIFLPVVIIGNALLTRLPFSDGKRKMRCKNIFLLICSLFFYAWGGIYYILIMLGVIVLDFFGACWVSRQRGAGRKALLAATILLNLLILFFFKYFNMLVAMVETVMSWRSGTLQERFLVALFSLEGTGALGIEKIVLPIGISFFTFQAMSYVVDVYRDTVPPQTNILDFALYISLFPQLIAGPIVQYSDIAASLNHREESMEDFLEGVRRFCYGLGKKVLISNTLGNTADQIWAIETNELGAGLAWLGMISYTLQIYYDFSGYSDMAIGLGRMLGFKWKENFDYPYTSLSIQEFWRRWHISLSSWFKNYVYIPLGGNRKGMAATCRNLMIVFLLTGIWHGANFTFIFWGLMYAVLLVAERLFLGRLLQKNPLKFVNWLYTMFFVMIGWVFFRSDNLVIARRYVRQLFCFGTSEYSVLSYLSMQVILALVLGILGMGFIQRAIHKKPRICGSFAVQIAILVLSILFIAAGTYNPFIYFQF